MTTLDQTWNTPPEENLKIFRYCAVEDVPNVPPMGLNYKTGLNLRLQKQVQMVQGETQAIVYYASAVAGPAGPIYSDPVVREDIVFARDSVGNAVSQTKTISWYREDGALCPTTKMLEKFYSPAESIGEGQRRRKNVIDYLKGATIGLLMQTEMPTGKTAEEVMQMGRDFVAFYKSGIASFIDASSQTLHTQVVADSTHGWLDNANPYAPTTTIRDFFLAELNIWGL